MGSQKVVNNPLGSYPVDVDRDASANTRQAVGIDFGTVSGGVYTASRVSATNPLPVTGTITVGSSVTVNNAAGASAVNIQDGGNSITVDGAVTVSGTVAVTQPVAVTDNSGSLTVDGTVAVSSVGGTVAVSAASLPLPTGAATLAEQQTQTASLSVMDDWDETDRAKVNLIVGQAGIAAGTGVDGVTVPRVTLATNVGLPTGSNTIGAVTNTVLSVVGNGAAATAQRVTLANDSTGVLATVSTVTTVGTVTNITNQGQLVDNAGFTDGTTRLNMSGYVFDEVAGTALTENDGAAARVDSKRAQVFTLEDATTRGQRATVTAANALKVDGSAVTQPVSAASLPLPTGAATSANQSTEITSLQLIDDIVFAEDVAHTTGDKGALVLSRRADTASSSAGTDGDYATLNTDANGRLHVRDSTTGGSSQQVQGPSAVGASITTGNLFPCGFKDLFGNGVVPTGLDASGVVVMGVLPLDLALNIQDFSPSGEVYVTGLLAHDAVDSGGPIKTGGKAASYAPATSDQPSANKTAVASGDRTDGAFNLYGEAVEGVNGYYFTLDNVSTTYNNTTTTATSAAKNCWNYRQASFTYELTKANSPTDILFEVEVSLDGTNYAVMQNDFLGDLRESAASVGSGIKKSVTFAIAAQKIRVKATATGTTASATFTVANAVLYLRN